MMKFGKAFCIVEHMLHDAMADDDVKAGLRVSNGGDVLISSAFAPEASEVT